MRHMSFALSTPQILNRSKTVTRRIGWTFLTPGTLLQAVEKSQGLKKGQKVRRLAVIRVKDVRGEALDAITREDVVREGFPEMTPDQFVTSSERRQVIDDDLSRRTARDVAHAPAASA